MKKAVMSVNSNKIGFFKVEKTDWEAMKLSYKHWDTHWQNKIKWEHPYWISEPVDIDFASDLRESQSVLKDANFSQIHVFFWHFGFKYQDIIFKARCDWENQTSKYRAYSTNYKIEFDLCYYEVPTKHFFVLK